MEESLWPGDVEDLRAELFKVTHKSVVSMYHGKCSDGVFVHHRLGHHRQVKPFHAACVPIVSASSKTCDVNIRAIVPFCRNLCWQATRKSLGLSFRGKK